MTSGGASGPVFAEWTIEASRTGLPTALAGSRALHSRFDPVREAEKTAATVPDSAPWVILGGLGLGYVAEALLRAAPDRPILVVEADSEAPRRAMSARDCSALFSDRRFTVLAGGDPTDVRNIIAGESENESPYLLMWRPSVELAPDWYRRMKDAVDDSVRRRLVNARTLERFGRLWIRNLADNAAILPGALSLEPFEGALDGIPALILAGGPSLESVLPCLPALAERHLIISVDTALRAALRRGVRPDIVVAVDPQYWNTRHLDRCGPAAGDALVLSESAAHPKIFRTLEGRPWLTRTRFPLGTVLEDAARIRGELNAGGSVATAAWDLARHLGCSQLTVAGLDLGFPDGRTHYAGSLSRELPLVWATRTAPTETALFHALHDAGARPVPSADGGTLLSDRRMDVYAAWFTERMSVVAERNPARIGTVGRLIEGLGCIDLDEALSRPVCREEIDTRLNTIKNTPSDPEASNRVRDALDAMIRDLADLERLGIEGVGLTEDLKERLSGGDDAAMELEALDRLDQRLLSTRGRDVVSFLIQPIIRDASRRRIRNDGDPVEESRRLYAGIAESARYHCDILRRAW